MQPGGEPRLAPERAEPLERAHERVLGELPSQVVVPREPIRQPVHAIDVARGRAVGSLERALALTMVLLGDYAAVGWIIAAKSLARFKQLEDREFAEYFLVGTLASFLLAVLVGVGIRILLKQA